MTTVSRQNAVKSSASPSFVSGALSVVLFDLDDTLFDHQRAVALGVTAKRRAHGGAPAEADDAEEVRRWHHLEEVHYSRYLHGELDLQQQRRVRVQEFLRHHGIELDDDSADAWYADYLAHYDRSWILHQDAMPCLDQLESAIPGVQFGIITNAELNYQTPKLDRLGLSRRMRHVIASSVLGVPKPDARIFHHACDLFGVEPKNAAYVGDRLQTDARGAVGAGLTGVWLDRGVVVPDPDEVAEAKASGVLTISTLTELPALLAR
ncbi:MAG TPA: HAD family hydrolase [Homoserinimonas sp.]|nr:HAD family hydrolase [Homoserinimonas sp.]